MRNGTNCDASTAIAGRVRELQKDVLKLLMLAIILKVLSFFLPMFAFPSGAVLLVFFLAEILLLPPVGMLLMCLVASVLFLFLYPMVQIILGLLIDSLFLMVVGLVVSTAISGVYLTFYNGMLWAVEYISFTGPAYFGMTLVGINAGLTAAAGAGIYTAVSGAGDRAVRKASRKMLLSMLGSIMVFVCIGWPCLSYSQAITGALACKPAVALNQAHLNYWNIGTREENKEQFTDEKKWVFRSGFYSEYINNGRNNITQGGDVLMAGNDNYMAIVYRNLVHVLNQDVSDRPVVAGYSPRQTDAMVLKGDSAYIFGHDRVFYASPEGNYTWKKTKWTSEFEKMSDEDRFDRIYDILWRQSITVSQRFSYDEVGVVAYAQRNGLLLDYDDTTQQAWFARTDEKGRVTVYLQTGPGQREEQVSFVPDNRGKGLPYILMKDDAIVFLKENRVMALDMHNNWEEVCHFTNPKHGGEEHNLVGISYMDLGEEGRYLIYMDEKDKIYIDTCYIGVPTLTPCDFDISKTVALPSCGNFIYSLQYDDTLLSRLTYLPDLRNGEGWLVREIWADTLDYQRLWIKQSIFLPE